MQIDWGIVEMALPLLARGSLVTIQISISSAIIACLLGFAIGLASLSNVRMLRWMAGAYVDFIRGTPLLIQIFLVFFVLPLVGIRLSEIWAGIIALAVNGARR